MLKSENDQMYANEKDDLFSQKQIRDARMVDEEIELKQYRFPFLSG